MTDHRRERRRTPRMSTAGAAVAVRIRPGRDAIVINLSREGALIETCHRLLPGAIVDLQLDASARRIAIRGRVLRCSVAAVRPTSLVYRGAIAFDRAVAWSTGDDLGNPLPGSGGEVPPGSGASDTRAADV